MKGFTHSVLLSAIFSVSVMVAEAETIEYPASLPLLKTVDYRQQPQPTGFSRFAQCQVDITTTAKPRENGILGVAEPERLARRLHQCLDTAVAKDVDILVFPEYAADLPEKLQNELFKTVKAVTAEHQMIVVAGSFIDEQRHNRIAVFGPDWQEFGYKLNPSLYEVSYLAGKGVEPGESLLLLKTDHGRLLIITCVDLISDEVQFVARQLATRGDVDVVVNINHNPAAWEFLIEANSIARRHPVFVSVTNVVENMRGRCQQPDGTPVDTGRCAGHSAVFAAMNERQGKLPADPQMLAFLPPPALTLDDEGKPVSRALPYDRMAADLGAFVEGMLIYDLNIRRKVVPQVSNAPDQGYPSIRNIQKIIFPPLTQNAAGTGETDESVD